MMRRRALRRDQATVSHYIDRSEARELTLMTATMAMVQYFMGLGDDLPTANGKVSQISSENANLLYVYTLGNTQPLIDSINASALPFMDAAAKAYVTGLLIPPV